MPDVLLMLGVVFAVNVVPAFAPPTWTVLVYFLLRYDIPEPVLVVGGAAAAACGRYVLALVSRRFGNRFLSERKRGDLRAVGERLERPRSRIALLAIFVVSPLPSAQLFVAAGLTPNLRLPPLTAAFFCGRLVSYTLYVGGASVAEQSLEALLDEGVTSPATIALQVALLALLAAFLLIPWARILRVEEHRDGR